MLREPAVQSQSRSKSRVGLVIGSWFACFSASSKRRDSASPRVFSAVDRLLKDRLAPGGFVRQNPLRVAQLGLVAALGLVVRDDPPQIEIDDRAWSGSTGRRLRVPI